MRGMLAKAIVLLALLAPAGTGRAQEPSAEAQGALRLWADLDRLAAETVATEAAARAAAQDNIAAIKVIDPFLDQRRPLANAITEFVTATFGGRPAEIDRGIYLRLGYPEAAYAPTEEVWAPIRARFGFARGPGQAFDAMRSGMEYLVWAWGSIEKTEFGKAFNEIDFVRTYLGDAVPLAEKEARLRAVQARVFELREAFGADDEVVVKLLGLLGEIIPNLAALEAEELAGRSWPAAFAGFAGPGAPEALAEAALAYLDAAFEDRVLVVQVSGNWFVAARNLLGEPVQHALPVQVVLASPAEEGRGVGRTAELHLFAAEGAGTLPPFVGHAGVVGLFNGAQILLARVPGGGRETVLQP